MDYTIFIIIGILCLAIGILIGVKLLQKKGIISQDDVLTVAKWFDLGLDIVKELKLEKENYVSLIGDIVNDGIQYVIAIFDNEKEFEKLSAEVYNYVEDKCIALDIKLNENRIKIIKTLINIGLEKALEI